MSKKVNFLSSKMNSARNLLDPRPLAREGSFKQRKDASSQSIPAEKPAKSTNEHLRLMIDGVNPYSKEAIFAEIIRILHKPQPERNALDIKFLVFATSNIKFFQKTAVEMGAKTYEKICNYIEYSHYNAGETIFNLGRVFPYFSLIFPLFFPYFSLIFPYFSLIFPLFFPYFPFFSLIFPLFYAKNRR